MKERFILLPSFFQEDGMVWFHDLWINPFQIESISEIDISYTDPESQMSVTRNGMRIVTRSGQQHDIDMTIDDFMDLKS